jgi:hypothetical protein
MKNTPAPPGDKPSLLDRCLADDRNLVTELGLILEQVLPVLPHVDLGGNNTLHTRLSLLMGLAAGRIMREPVAPPGRIDGVCRLCGCTDDFGCESGCAWVEPDLCSRCAPFLEAIREGYEFDDLLVPPAPTPAPKVRAPKKKKRAR